VALGDVVPTVVAVVALRPNGPDVEGGLEPADFLSVLSCTAGVHCWKIQQVPSSFCRPYELLWHLLE